MRRTRWRAGVCAAVLVLGGALTSGCSVISAARRAVSDVEANKAKIDAFADTVKSGESATFEATYTTTGSAPATVVYAVEPPTGVTFRETPSASGATGVDLIANASGEYSCSAAPSGSTAGPSCEKLGTATAAAENNLFAIYTPAHWVSFLNDFALAAGLAGDKVTSSTMTVNGFALSCVDLQAPGISGTSTICSTAQGVLGYARVASDSTSFDITSFTSSPAASLFALPAGATVTTTPTSTTP